MRPALDARTVRRAMGLFAQALREHRDEIDSLNVYPVPDGDTGTNMLLTQEAVEAELRVVEAESPSLRRLGQLISRASLVGARGNSGVILSQVLRGLTERLPEEGEAGVRDLAEALAHAADEAERAVARPQEGTVLTVLRDAAGAARDAAEGAPDCAVLVDQVLEAARRSLERTREVLPELREAGVVDAGAKGVVLLFDAMRAALRGTGLTEAVGPMGPVGPGAREDEARPDPRFPFEVQYLLEAREDRFATLRRGLGELGDSLAVVGGGGLYNVHVHTDRPGRAVELGIEAGRPRNVSIVHLPTSAEPCRAAEARGVRLPERAGDVPRTEQAAAAVSPPREAAAVSPPKQVMGVSRPKQAAGVPPAEQACALVASCEAEGLAEVFRSLGAIVVGGSDSHPASEAELAAALEAAPAAGVIVLPNDPSVVPAARAAAAASGKDARVLLTAVSVPAGLAAAAAFNPALGVHHNVRGMSRDAAAVRVGEVVRAGRDGRGGPGGRAVVGDGSWLALSGGDVLATAPSPAAAAAALIGRLAGDEAEIVTVVVGAGVSEEEARAVEEAIRQAAPRVQTEVVRGGQPGRPFLVGVE